MNFLGPAGCIRNIGYSDANAISLIGMTPVKT